MERFEKTPLATACSHSGDHLLALRHVDAADLVACSLRSRSTAIVSAAIEQFTSDTTEELELDTDLTFRELATSCPIAITTCFSLHAAGDFVAPDPHALATGEVPGSGFRVPQRIRTNQADVRARHRIRRQIEGGGRAASWISALLSDATDSIFFPTELRHESEF